MGAPVGRALGRYSFENALRGDRGDGSIMMVVATDAPLSDRNLERLASRAIMGLARTGSFASNGSGDYVIAFSTAAEVRRPWNADRLRTEELANEQTSALYAAVVEATEEAIYNSIFMATSVTSRGRTMEAIPLDRVRAVLRDHGIGAR
jgi:D-aminopeptidase